MMGLERFEGKEVKIRKKIGDKIFFYQGYVTKVTDDSLLLEDRLKGLTYLSRTDIVCLEEVQ